MKPSSIKNSAFLATIAVVASHPGVVWAQQESAAAQETSIHGGTLVLAAYICLWVLIFGFVFFVMRRQRAVQDDLEGLERRLDDLFGDSLDS